MNLHALLSQRAADNKPLRVLLIGAGKFGSMFLSQVRRTPGLHLVAVADLTPQRARESLARVGWPAEQFAAASLEDARKRGATFITDDAPAAIAGDAVEIVIDATGSPAAASLSKNPGTISPTSVPASAVCISQLPTLSMRTPEMFASASLMLVLCFVQIQNRRL